MKPWRPDRHSSILRKALYIGMSEWQSGKIRAAAALACELKIQIVSNQSQYSML